MRRLVWVVALLALGGSGCSGSKVQCDKLTVITADGATRTFIDPLRNRAWTPFDKSYTVFYRRAGDAITITEKWGEGCRNREPSDQPLDADEIARLCEEQSRQTRLEGIRTVSCVGDGKKYVPDAEAYRKGLRWGQPPELKR